MCVKLREKKQRHAAKRVEVDSVLGAYWGGDGHGEHADRPRPGAPQKKSVGGGEYSGGGRVCYWIINMASRKLYHLGERPT